MSACRFAVDKRYCEMLLWGVDDPYAELGVEDDVAGTPLPLLSLTESEEVSQLMLALERFRMSLRSLKKGMAGGVAQQEHSAYVG
jgi:hypothetical protein